MSNEMQVNEVGAVIRKHETVFVDLHRQKLSLEGTINSLSQQSTLLATELEKKRRELSEAETILASQHTKLNTLNSEVLQFEKRTKSLDDIIAIEQQKTKDQQMTFEAKQKEASTSRLEYVQQVAKLSQLLSTMRLSTYNVDELENRKKELNDILNQSGSHSHHTSLSDSTVPDSDTSVSKTSVEMKDNLSNPTFDSSENSFMSDGVEMDEERMGSLLSDPSAFSSMISDSSTEKLETLDAIFHNLIQKQKSQKTPWTALSELASENGLSFTDLSQPDKLLLIRYIYYMFCHMLLPRKLISMSFRDFAMTNTHIVGHGSPLIDFSLLQEDELFSYLYRLTKSSVFSSMQTILERIFLPIMDSCVYREDDEDIDIEASNDNRNSNSSSNVVHPTHLIEKEREKEKEENQHSLRRPQFKSHILQSRIFQNTVKKRKTQVMVEEGQTENNFHETNTGADTGTGRTENVIEVTEYVEFCHSKRTKTIPQKAAEKATQKATEMKVVTHPPVNLSPIQTNPSQFDSHSTPFDPQSPTIQFCGSFLDQSLHDAAEMILTKLEACLQEMECVLLKAGFQLPSA